MTMKKIFYPFLLIMLTLVMSSFTRKDDPLDKIAIAIQAGNASGLAAYFDNNVEITILDVENIYSKAQSEQVVKDFFIKYPPSSFKIIHRGESGGTSMYGIGTLTTSKGNFRTSIVMKKDGTSFLIQKLKFNNA